MNKDELFELLYSRPAPCDFCWERDACRNFKLACSDFQVYTRNNGRGKGREPTRAIYDEIFGGSDDQD